VPSAIVDIVVPVYRGERETRACLESLLASPTSTARELLVIDDASPEPSIRAWLRELAKSGAISLIEHPANLGFVASVNEGMAAHPDRDVVLLNSDTEVAPGWLDRLTAHARGDPAVATATPFSSNATICSYPRTLVANALPAAETTATMDAAFASANAGRSASIPTAVGFCMYIARRCLDDVGAFDEARYGTGYGEEVDFCMRAARAGWRNVIAGDVFVRHVGEVSFAGAGAERRLKAQATVDALYPEFQVELRRFLATDPVRPLRRRADIERLRRSPLRRRLVIAAAPSQERGDGAETLSLSLAPHGTRHIRLRWEKAGEEFCLWFPHEDWAGIAAVIGFIGIAGRPSPWAAAPELEERWLAPPEGLEAPVTAQAHRAIEAWIEALRPRIEDTGAAGWLGATATRLRKLLSRGRTGIIP